MVLTRLTYTLPHLYTRITNIRGLSTLIHNDYSYSSLDCSEFFHASVEIHDIQVDCSLDEPLYIFNIYRHPNVNMPFTFYSKVFTFATTHKYVLFVGDFNAHHSDWGGSEIGPARRADLSSMWILSTCDYEWWAAHFSVLSHSVFFYYRPFHCFEIPGTAL